MAKGKEIKSCKRRSVSMKTWRYILFTFIFAVQFASAQVIRPFTVRYNNPSIRGNIVYVSNSIITSSGVGSGSPGTGEVPPAGSTRNNVGSGVYLDVDNPSPVTLFTYGS